MVGGVRGSFDEGYPLVPVMGKGAEERHGELHSILGGGSELAKIKHEVYAPCFGNAVQALKK